MAVIYDEVWNRSHGFICGVISRAEMGAHRIAGQARHQAANNAWSPMRASGRSLPGHSTQRRSHIAGKQLCRLAACSQRLCFQWRNASAHAEMSDDIFRLPAIICMISSLHREIAKAINESMHFQEWFEAAFISISTVTGENITIYQSPSSWLKWFLAWGMSWRQPGKRHQPMKVLVAVAMQCVNTFLDQWEMISLLYFIPSLFSYKIK